MSLEPSTPVLDSQRDAVVAHLRSLVGAGVLGLDDFSALVTDALAVRDAGDLAQVLGRVPPPIRMTPPDRRLHRPLRLGTTTGKLDLRGVWQVGATTTARVVTGSILLDLTRAEFDARDTELHLWVVTGKIVVIVPAGLDVRFRKVHGTLVNKLGEQASLPGAPTLFVTASAQTGGIVFKRPRAPRRLTWRPWRRRA